MLASVCVYVRRTHHLRLLPPWKENYAAIKTCTRPYQTSSMLACNVYYCTCRLSNLQIWRRSACRESLLSAPRGGEWEFHWQYCASANSTRRTCAWSSLALLLHWRLLHVQSERTCWWHRFFGTCCSQNVCNSALVVENTLLTSTDFTYGQHVTV